MLSKTTAEGLEPPTVGTEIQCATITPYSQSQSLSNCYFDPLFIMSD